ncbi:hypothetical protein EYF80_000454 [Liparis tanakae]|uniref:Uncharacterized protein n=1 Tax=Liparis tanakae TaxID=230148 RepID=A0A4Z2JFY6_9TELE|nr:hypothetical protein EYF80_000454 [Liparis tanakae]
MERRRNGKMDVTRKAEEGKGREGRRKAERFHTTGVSPTLSLKFFHAVSGAKDVSSIRWHQKAANQSGVFELHLI